MLRLNNLKKIAIIDEVNKRFTYEELNLEINRIESILMYLKPESILIRNSGSFLNVACIMAALQTNTTYTVVSPDAPEYEYYTKLSMLNPDIIFTDLGVEEYRLVINLKRNAVEVGKGYKLLMADSYIFIHKLLTKVHSSTSYYVSNEIDPKMACFHRGASVQGYKFSMHLFKHIYKGLTKSQVYLGYEKKSTVLYLENLELLYNVINGVLAPLANGSTVKFVGKEPLDTKLWNTVLYSSTYLLETYLATLLNAMPKSINNCITRPVALRYAAIKYFGTNINRLILNGKPSNTSLINNLNRKVTLLYTMCEVASFVSCKTHRKLNEKSSVGNPVDKDSIKILSNSAKEYGPIMIHTEDMCVSTNQSYSIESFFHVEPGRLNTKDIGYLDKKGEVVIINKSNLIYETHYGKLIEIGKYTDYALSQNFVKNVQIIRNDKGRLIMYIEPNLEWAVKEKLSVFNLYDLTYELEENFKKKFKHAYPMSLFLYLEEDGLDQQFYKIINRRETL